MARESEEGLLTADTILQNLSKRPNVRSTLILSRKDGSIIKATGLIADNVGGETQQNSPHDGVGPPNSTEETDREVQSLQDNKEEVGDAEPTISPAQILAESIHTFVASAGALAESLGKIDILADASRTRNEAGRTGSQKADPTTSDTASQSDSEVQLLRLRLKKQEVIIFPDPQYLCCVVQDLEKGLR